MQFYTLFIYIFTKLDKVNQNTKLIED